MYKLFLTFLVITLMLPFPVLAQTVTPSPTVKPTEESTTQNLSNQINSLKEKIASRVAQLNLVEKRGVIGIVKEVEGTTILITDINSRNRSVDVDEITKFSSPDAKSTFGISDIKPGTKLSIIGLYNKDSERILARFISVISNPVIISGAVSKIDDEDFTIIVSTEKEENFLIDIEKITKIHSYSDGEVTKIGFTKIEEGYRIMIVGYPQKNDSKRIIGTRVLLFPDLPRNPKIILSTTTDEIIPSTGSGKILTPIR